MNTRVHSTEMQSVCAILCHSFEIHYVCALFLTVLNCVENCTDLCSGPKRKPVFTVWVYLGKEMQYINEEPAMQ